jgi:putative membrane protein
MLRMTKPAIAGLMIAVAVSACSKTDTSNGNVDTTAANRPADTTSAAAATVTPDSMNNANSSKWNAPTLLGYATVADMGEIQMGKLGEQKATAADVKAFAKEMVTDHTKMLAADKALAKKLTATPDTTADDAKDLMNHGHDATKELTDKAKGADWDKNYMDKMVDDHQNVLAKLQDAAKSNTDSTVTKALSDATAKVQEHLTKAQAIRAKMP